MQSYKRKIRGSDSLVRGVELKVNLGNSGQTKTICRPLQLIIPFEIHSCVDNEPKGRRTTTKANGSN